MNTSTPSTDCIWMQNSFVKVEQCSKSAVRILANKEGLLSLSQQLLALAEKENQAVLYEVFPGDLEEGSLCMEIVHTPLCGRASFFFYAKKLQLEELSHKDSIEQTTTLQTAELAAITTEEKTLYDQFLQEVKAHAGAWLQITDGRAFAYCLGDYHLLCLCPSEKACGIVCTQNQCFTSRFMPLPQLEKLILKRMQRPQDGFLIPTESGGGVVVSADKLWNDLFKHSP